MDGWKRSRFNAQSNTPQGDLILYNSLTGAIGVVSSEDRDLVESTLKMTLVTSELIGQSEILQQMVENGFLVDQSKDEQAVATQFHKDYYGSDKILQLIVFPTEECNFRCIYCYESFVRGTMHPHVVTGIKNLVDKKIEGLETLVVSWFGGEPTEAMDVILDLSEYIIDKCIANGVQYGSGMTTNGYNLTPEVFDTLVNKCKVTNYQITIDGTKEDHDARRIRRDGSSTYDRIFENLVEMSKTDFDFSVTIRNNFDPDSFPKIGNFLDELTNELKHDERFKLFFHPVGKWGGPNDDAFTVCVDKEAATRQYELFDLAASKGLESTLADFLRPGGSVCYAAKPWSIGIGSDGTLYKCTVALYDERNQVGQLLEDGTLALNYERYNLWVDANESNDPGCQACFFRPSCQGAACPLERLDTNKSPCPTTKTYIRRTLTAVAGAN